MTDVEIIDTHKELQLTFQQRLDSLQLQLNSISGADQQKQLIQSLFDGHMQCRMVRGDQLISKQSKIVERKEKESELLIYQSKIKEQLGLISRKEVDIWQQNWEGKRIKNIKLHRESIYMFEYENKKVDAFIKQIKERKNLLCQIDQLKKPEQEVDIGEQTPYINLSGIDTKVLLAIEDEEDRYEQLLALEAELKKQLEDISLNHKQLVDIYQNKGLKEEVVDDYQNKGLKEEVANSKQSIPPETSSKTISTEGDEPQL